MRPLKAKDSESESEGAPLHTETSSSWATHATGVFQPSSSRFPALPSGSPVRMSEQARLTRDDKPDYGRKSFNLGSSASIPTHIVQNSQEALHSLVVSWASRKFMQGCAILLPIAVTVYTTWWFLSFFDEFFSPIYHKLFGLHVFGLGFITSMLFIFLVGVFLSTWLGSLLLGFGEWAIMHLPIVKQIYSASKQVSSAVSPDELDGNAFKECVLVNHPRNGSYGIAFVTGSTVLNMPDGSTKKLFAVFVPTNHVYLGDVLLLSADDVLHTGMTVSEGMEIVVSLGMGVPSNLTARATKSLPGTFYRDSTAARK